MTAPTNGNAKLWGLGIIVLASLFAGGVGLVAYRDTKIHDQAELNAAQDERIKAIDRRVSKLEDCD